VLVFGVLTAHPRATPIVDYEHRICSTSFIDDMQLYSTTPRGVELRLAICSLFFEFFDVQFNLNKTRVLANLWEGDEYDF